MFWKDGFLEFIDVKSLWICEYIKVATLQVDFSLSHSLCPPRSYNPTITSRSVVAPLPTSVRPSIRPLVRGVRCIFHSQSASFPFHVAQCCYYLLAKLIRHGHNCSVCSTFYLYYHLQNHLTIMYTSSAIYVTMDRQSNVGITIQSVWNDDE